MHLHNKQQLVLLIYDCFLSVLGPLVYVRHYSEGLIDYLQIEHDETTCFQLVIHWVKE